MVGIYIYMGVSYLPISVLYVFVSLGVCVISNQSTGKIHINVSDPPTERSVGVRVGGDREVGEGVGQNLKRGGGK